MRVRVAVLRQGGAHRPRVQAVLRLSLRVVLQPGASHARLGGAQQGLSKAGQGAAGGDGCRRRGIGRCSMNWMQDARRAFSAAARRLSVVRRRGVRLAAAQLVRSRGAASAAAERDVKADVDWHSNSTLCQSERAAPSARLPPRSSPPPPPPRPLPTRRRPATGCHWRS